MGQFLWHVNGISINLFKKKKIAAERRNPTSKELRLRRHKRAERSYSTFKVRRGGSEEIPLVQGKEQRLHFLEQP